jgi:hypothetical protein
MDWPQVHSAQHRSSLRHHRVPLDARTAAAYASPYVLSLLRIASPASAVVPQSFLVQTPKKNLLFFASTPALHNQVFCRTPTFSALLICLALVGHRAAASVGTAGTLKLPRCRTCPLSFNAGIAH